MNELTVTNKVVVPNEVFGNLTVINGEQGMFFIGKEVATMLGYKNSRDAISKHCKKKEVVKCDTLGGSQSMTIIPESDVYRLIIKSKLPAAEKFEEWVMEEVLPEIRKTGGYSVQPAIPQTYVEALRLAANLEEEKQMIIEEKKVLEIQVAEDAPKLEVYAGLIDTEQLISMQTAANNLNVGLIVLYKYLRKQNILKSSYSQKNLPYQTYIDRGYFEVKSKTYNNSITGKSGISFSAYVTGLGMAWLEQNLPDNM